MRDLRGSRDLAQDHDFLNLFNAECVGLFRNSKGNELRHISREVVRNDIRSFQGGAANVWLKFVQMRKFHRFEDSQPEDKVQARVRETASKCPSLRITRFKISAGSLCAVAVR